jgi:hypothetical protein
VNAETVRPITSPITLKTAPIKSDEIANAGEVLSKTVIRRKRMNGTAVSMIGALIPTIFRFRPRARSPFVISLERTKSLILKRLLYKQLRFNSN